MSFKDAIRSGLEEYLANLHQTLDGLTSQELRLQAQPDANHIIYIVWHMARVEDGWIARASGLDQIWILSDWPQILGLNPERTNSGVDWSIDQVREMPVVAIEDLLGYYADVRDRTLAVFDKMTEADMGTTHVHGYYGTVTNAWIFGHIIVEESQHLGQIAFIRGMQRGLGG